MSSPLAPAAKEGEIQPEPHSGIQRLVALELFRVADHFLVEKGFEVGAFVAARLVVDSPALAVARSEMAVEDVGASAFRRASAQAIFGARLRMRAERPCAAF